MVTVTVGIGFLTLLVGSAFLPIRMSDRAKIETIFKNVRVGIQEDRYFKTPKFKFKRDIIDGGSKIGTTYFYRIPLGLPASVFSKASTNLKVFEDSLRKPVELEFEDGYLQVHVFDNPIPKLVHYSDITVEPPSKWAVPLGVSARGIVWHNFDHIPHMTVAGSTRFGKTVLLKTLMTWLIEHNPEDVEFYIIDLKGGLEFNRFAKLKQVKAVAKNPLEAVDVFQRILNDIRMREEHYLRNGYTDVTEAQLRKRTFVITDEAAQLTPQKYMMKAEKDMLAFCQHALGEICRIAGALGYRNILATQYPTVDCLPRQVKMNSDIKITFRLSTGYASEVAIDEPGAENLPTDIKGRALVKTHYVRQVQVPYITTKEMEERLRKWEDEKVIEYREETVETRENLVQFI